MSNGEGTTTPKERNDIASEVRKLTEDIQKTGWGTDAKTDPTKLTQDAVDRASGQWEQRLLSEIQILVTQLQAMDKATQLNAERLDKMSIDGHAEHDHLMQDVARQIRALQDLHEERMDGSDKATQLLADQLVKFPTDIDRSADAIRDHTGNQVALSLAETARVRDIMLEKFSKVEAQFVSNDKALTAALAAQEKAAAEQQKSNTLAIDKSEKTTQEQSKANQAQTAASIDSQAANIADLKDRVVRLESGGVATREAHQDQRSDNTYAQDSKSALDAKIRANVSITVAVIVGILALVAFALSLIPH